MKLEEAQVQDIKAKYELMHTKEDLLALLNDILVLLYGEEASPISLKSLTYYSNPKLSTNCYKVFAISKKSGGVRKINAPAKGLKTIQRCLNVLLQCIYSPHYAATGFVLDKSIVDNAKPHIGKRYVLNLDLKDFFPSVDKARVWKCLQRSPFDLNAERSRLHLANVIAAICCTTLEVERLNANGEMELQKREVLPQGAPTSPTLTNIIAYKLDVRLTGLAKRFKVKYSRYADDITFSSFEDIFKEGGEFSKELQRIIKDQNFQINHKKTRLQGVGFRQEATGLVVNEKVNVHRHYIKQLRMWLYYWEKYGYSRAEKIFLKDYTIDRAGKKRRTPTLKAVLEGKLDFLRMVKGHDDSTYQKLQERFWQLNIPVSQPQKAELEDVLEALLNDGLEDAMNLFSSMK